jgi:uncharacterized protein (DUF1499 family)
MRRFLLSLIAIGTAIVVTFANIAPAIANTMPLAAIFHFSGKRPTDLGVQQGQFAPCPPSPNCVSSQASDPGHNIAAIALTGSSDTALASLKAIVAAQPGAAIMTETENYLYAEFTSSLMGFVDDVEFFLDTENQVIQVRSASRLGESDLGANRQRIEKIRAEFNG